MKDDQPHAKPMRACSEDALVANQDLDTPQTRAPSYRLAFQDTDLMLRPELRPVRLQLELLKPQMIMDELGIRSTVVMFGGARICPADRTDEKAPPLQRDLSRYYAEAERFAYLMTQRSMEDYGRDWVICTGGGPGIMEAGNKGAQEAGGHSIGLGIVLPKEPTPNAYITPALSFNFHYFALRKMHFLMRARAIAVFPGGFGTLDELFEALTLIQTKRMKEMPFLLFGRAFWERIIDWDGLVEAGMVAREDLDLISYVETAEEAMAVLEAYPEREC